MGKCIKSYFYELMDKQTDEVYVFDKYINLLI